MGWRKWRAQDFAPLYSALDVGAKCKGWMCVHFEQLINTCNLVFDLPPVQNQEYLVLQIL